MAASAEATWVVGSPPVAAVSAWRADPRGRRRRELREAAVAVALVMVGIVVVPLIILAVQGLPWWLTTPMHIAFDVGSAAFLAVVGWSMLYSASLRGAMQPVRAARQQVAANGAGSRPVWEVGALVSIDPGAGTALAGSLCDLADAADWVLLAQADRPARARLYRRFGFAPVARAELPWGRATCSSVSRSAHSLRAAFEPT